MQEKPNVLENETGKTSLKINEHKNKYKKHGTIIFTHERNKAAPKFLLPGKIVSKKLLSEQDTERHSYICAVTNSQKRILKPNVKTLLHPAYYK